MPIIVAVIRNSTGTQPHLVISCRVWTVLSQVTTLDADTAAVEPQCIKFEGEFLKFFRKEQSLRSLEYENP